MKSGLSCLITRLHRVDCLGLGAREALRACRGNFSAANYERRRHADLQHSAVRAALQWRSCRAANTKNKNLLFKVVYHIMLC